MTLVLIGYFPKTRNEPFQTIVLFACPENIRKPEIFECIRGLIKDREHLPGMS